jgi:hypothetical protein
MASYAGKLSPVVRFEEGQGLPYFQACVKEALRLFPAGMHMALNECTVVSPMSDGANENVVGCQLPRIALKSTHIDRVYIPRGVSATHAPQARV